MSRRVEQASRWMYRGIWSVIVNWFRVPAEPPTLPVHASDQVKSFQPAEGYLRYLKFWFWTVGVAIDVVLTIATLVVSIIVSVAGYWWIVLLIVPPALVIIILPDIIAYVAMHLRYDTMWYVMTDRSLRIRRGIWIIHETTITFENVQNLKVQQGPVQRHFGIANLVVETAGAGGDQHQKGAGGVSNRGIIEGVANVHELRDRILKRMRESKFAGLGDESEAEARAHRTAPTSAWTADHLAALREVRNEIQLLANS